MAWQSTLVLFPRESHGQRGWWTAVHGVLKSQTRSNWACTRRHCRCNQSGGGRAGVGWGFNPIWSGVLTKGDTWTDTHTQSTSCEDEGRDQGDASTSQEAPTMTSKPPAAPGKTWIWSSSQPQREPCLLTPGIHFQPLDNPLDCLDCSESGSLLKQS